MSNSPTIITNPTPLIQNQPGTITYYVDVTDNSSNFFPAPNTTYVLQNSSSTTLSTFKTYPYNEDLSSNFQYLLNWPAASTFDENGYYYVVDAQTSFITAFNPNFNQTSDYNYVNKPFGIKFNPRDGNLYVTCLYNDADINSQYGAIITLTANHNPSLNPSGLDFTYNDFFDTSGNIGGNPKTDYCFIPYDIEFGNSGNVFVSNFGYYPDSAIQKPGFISRLIVNNNVVTSAEVIISAGVTPLGCQDPSFSYPSGMAYDLSNNYLYVANVNISNGEGVITMYSINAVGYPGVQKRLTIPNVGNNPNSFFGITNGQPVTSLKFDNYGNLYYIYVTPGISPIVTYINAISISVDGFGNATYDLVYSKKIKNISSNFSVISSYNNNAYGLAFSDGNIYMTCNLYTSLNRKVPNSILSIQNAFKFSDVSINNDQTLSILPNSSPASLNTFNVNVSSFNKFVSNLTSYTNQAAILTYFDNINNANELVPTGNYTYNLVDSNTNSIATSVKMVANNETLYAPYSNELGSLNYPISMDFDSSGNLYVLNSATNGSVFLNIITPGSGNFQEVYIPSLSIVYPSAIRYNKNDNCMYISSFGGQRYGKINQVKTKILYNNSEQIQFQLTMTTFYACQGNNFSHCPVDLVFDEESLIYDTGYIYISSTGSLNQASGIEPAAWNANITRITLLYNQPETIYVTGSEKILVNQNYLSNYISGIEVDASYIYVVNSPDVTEYSSYSSTKFGNCYTNISQFSKTTGQLIQRFNAGYVGKLPDIETATLSNLAIRNISSTLKFDKYGNLFYITYYDVSNYTQPYYLDGSGSILYNPPTSGNYYVQAFVPTSNTETPVFTHTMTTNPLQPIYGLALYNGDIYVAQYTQNQIIKLTYSLSFGNYGFGITESQSSLILYNQNNSYYITGGNSPIYGININASHLPPQNNSPFIDTLPSPLIANSPGELSYSGNPVISTPAANTTYVLVNSSGKKVSNTYTTLPGNEGPILYKELSNPRCMTLDSEQNLYIANSGHEGIYKNGTIIKSTTAGEIIYIKQNINIANPYAIQYNSIDGYIYYANSTPNIISGVEYFYIYKMSTDGNTFTQVFQDSSLNYLYNPLDMCFDSSGNIYISNGSTTTSSGAIVNGSITKITMGYPPTYSEATPIRVRVFSNYLSGFPLDSSGNVLISGLAIDSEKKYLYAVAGTNEASINNISICQIPTTGNNSGNVCRYFQKGAVGNIHGQCALSFDEYGNLYYYYYNPSTSACYLNGFYPYTNTNESFSHTLLGGATSGAYGITSYHGIFFSSQSTFNTQSQVYIDNVVVIFTYYLFSGVTLSPGKNVLSINTTIPNQVVIPHIVVYASAPKYYTIPAPPIAGKPAKLIYEFDGVIIPVNGHKYVVVDSNLNYVSGILTYNSASEPNPFTFTFNNLILPGGGNHLYIFDITLGQILKLSNMFIKIPVVCFYKGTKILCLINGKEMYVPIEKIGQGTLIKTYKRGYRKVKHNIMGKLHNTREHSIDKLFKLSKKRFPELMEDLYVTGSHALLHDSLNVREVFLMKQVIQYAASNYESIYNEKIEDKFKLLAYHDERFEEIMMNAVFEIYHIVLENEDKNFNYGIYANGILAESTDELTLMRMKGYEKINKTPEGLELFVNSMNTTKYPVQLQRALKG